MAIDESPPSFFSPWPDRLRHSAIILLAAGLALAVLVVFGESRRWSAPPRSSSASPRPRWCRGDCMMWRRRAKMSARSTRSRPRRSAPWSPACRIPPCCSTAPAASSISTRRRRSSRRRCARTNWRNSRCARPRSSPRCAKRSRPRKPRRTTYLDHVPVDRWMELIITPVPVPTLFGGTDKCMLMTFHDQTPLRRVEEMRADFVANASHELRTPLAALSGFIDTLQGPAKDDARARERFLGIMHNQATRMARLIDDLLSLSRVELSAHVRPDTLVDLVPIIRQVADGLEPLAQRTPGRDRHRPAGYAGVDRRRSRGIAAAVREPDRERAEIRRLRRQGDGFAELGARPAKARRKSGSWCAISAPASRPSICRG